MLNINLKLLHMFLLVADHSSFRRAAEMSNRSEAAVSMQIKQLELQLGLALFHRTTRSVELTRDGEQLIASVRKGFSEIESGLKIIGESADLESGTLSIACVPTVAATRLPHILLAFQEEYPRINIQVREVVATELVESIRQRQVDFGIGPKFDAGTQFSFRPILRDKMYALLPTTYRLQRKKGVTLRELSQLPILMLTSLSAFRRELDAVLEARNLTLITKYEVRNPETLRAMAEAGLGAALLPGISVPARTRLQAVPVVEPALAREICIVTFKGQNLPPAAARLAAFVERLIGQVP